MKIFLRILPIVISCLVVPIIMALLMPKIQRKADENEAVAGKNKTVKLGKGLSMFFLASASLTNIALIVIAAVPSFIIDILEMNYIVVLCVWCTMTLFNDIMMIFMFTKATYDDEKITVKKIFRKAKDYYFSDITYFSPDRNLRVKTTKGSFLLFNAFEGTESLRDLLYLKCKPNAADKTFK